LKKSTCPAAKRQPAREPVPHFPMGDHSDHWDM
jgi:hypothetical protein